MKLDESARTLWRKATNAQKAAFFSCLVVGYLVHLYAFTNIVPNSDGLGRVYDLQQMTVSGRWFLHYATSLNAFTQMPAVIGLLSMLLLGVAAALTVDVLKVRSAIVASACGTVMAAFPCMGYTFLYMFTASAYCVGILLAVASVWVARKGRGGFALGAVLLAFSMGVYQAYAAVAITLALLAVMVEVLELRSTFRSAFGFGLRMVIYLGAGAVLYYVILLAFLWFKDLELLSYLGMDAASSGYPLDQLPALVLETYKQIIAFFLLPGMPNTFANPAMMVFTLMLLAVAAGAFGFLLTTEFGKEKWRPLVLVILAGVLPLGMGFSQIISPYTAPTPLMKYAYVGLYLAVFLMMDRLDGCVAKRSSVPIWTGLTFAALLLVNFLNTNNLLYTASAQAHRATESYLTRLMARVEACEGYTPGTQVVFVGAVPEEAVRSNIPSYARVEHYSVPTEDVAELNKHIYYYLSDWLSAPVEEPEEEVVIAIAASEEFAEMPLYPDGGGIRMMDGRVVVKLREEYTPKSDFEIAYENRK